MICVLSRRTKAQIALEKRLKSSSILLRSAGDEEDKEDDEEEEVVESGHFSQERDFSSVEGWGEEVGEEYSSFLSLMGLEEGEADLELTGFNGGHVVRSGGGADGGKDVKKFRINCYSNHFFKISQTFSLRSLTSSSASSKTTITAAAAIAASRSTAGRRCQTPSSCGSRGELPNNKTKYF